MRRLFKTKPKRERVLSTTRPFTLWRGVEAVGALLVASAVAVLDPRPAPVAPDLKLFAAIAGATGLLLVVVSEIAQARESPTAVAVSEVGVVIWRSVSAERFAWSEITGVRVGESSAELHTLRGDRTIPGHLGGWRCVAGAIRAHLSPAPPAASTLGARQVQQWLGVQSRWCLTGSPWQGLHAGLAVGFGATLVLWALGDRSSPILGPDALLMAAVLLGAIGLCGGWGYAAAMMNRVRASTRGLYNHRTGTCGWGDVLRVERTRLQWVIDTSAGQIQLWPGDLNAARIVETAQHVLDARARGHTLPRLVGVSDAALSPAEQTVDVELGLSGAARPE